MAIDFPNSPTNGETFTSGDRTWQYVAATNRWDLTGTKGSFYVSDTAPVGPVLGNVWYNSSVGKTYVYFDSYWVETGGDAGPTGPTGPTGPAGTAGSTGATGPQGTWALAQTVETKTGAYEIAAADAGKLIRMNATANFTVTSTTGFSVGQRVDVVRITAGACAVVQGSGATVTGTPGLNLRAQYSAASIVCVASNTYYVIGDLSA